LIGGTEAGALLKPPERWDTCERETRRFNFFSCTQGKYYGPVLTTLADMYQVLLTAESLLINRFQRNVYPGISLEVTHTARNASNFYRYIPT
jgi:hypothetical protein